MTFSIVHIVITLGLGIILGAVLLHLLGRTLKDEPYPKPSPLPMYEGLDDLEDQTRLQVRPRIAMGQAPDPEPELSDLEGISEEVMTEDHSLPLSEMSTEITIEDVLGSDETLPFGSQWENDKG